jgi:transposase
VATPPPYSLRELQYQLHTTITEKPDVVAKKRQEAGCFVLISNRPATGRDSQTPEQLLLSYKGQHAIEHNFGFLKDPLIVNDLFLKKPERIESLGMILMMSLLIWNLMQRSMRLYVQNHNTSIEGWDGKQTTRPTAFMMTTKFFGVFVIAMAGKRLVKPAFSKVQLKYLDALGVDESIFTDPKPG